MIILSRPGIVLFFTEVAFQFHFHSLHTKLVVGQVLAGLLPKIDPKWVKVCCTYFPSHPSHLNLSYCDPGDIPTVLFSEGRNAIWQNSIWTSTFLLGSSLTQWTLALTRALRPRDMYMMYDGLKSLTQKCDTLPRTSLLDVKIMT